MNNKKRIKQVFIDKDSDTKIISYFKTIKEASASIDTKIDDWKVQMFIVNAINTNKRAFKSKWSIVEN